MMRGDSEPVELSAHLSALTKAVNADAMVPTGRLYGLPELPDGGCWVDTAGAAALTGVPPNTITSWLARGGPLRNPFPRPARILYRLYWPRAEIESWRAREQPGGQAQRRSKGGSEERRRASRPVTEPSSGLRPSAEARAMAASPGVCGWCLEPPDQRAGLNEVGLHPECQAAWDAEQGQL
jgi:hypothetical protein